MNVVQVQNYTFLLICRPFVGPGPTSPPYLGCHLEGVSFDGKESFQISNNAWFLAGFNIFPCLVFTTCEPEVPLRQIDLLKCFEIV